MADGTRVVAGIGDTIWTEDVSDSRGKIPRSKLTLGALDVDGGDVSSSNPLPVKMTKGSKTFTTVAPTSVAAQVLASNSDRLNALIVNNGSMTVYLGKDNTVTTANGIPLFVGGSLEDDTSNDAWYAITATGTGDLRILEIQ